MGERRKSGKKDRKVWTEDGRKKNRRVDEGKERWEEGERKDEMKEERK